VPCIQLGGRGYGGHGCCWCCKYFVDSLVSLEPFFVVVTMYGPWPLVGGVLVVDLDVRHPLGGGGY
jgi:hypothetical protein